MNNSRPVRQSSTNHGTNHSRKSSTNHGTNHSGQSSTNHGTNRSGQTGVVGKRKHKQIENQVNCRDAVCVGKYKSLPSLP